MGVHGSMFHHHIPGLPRCWEGAGERRALGGQLELEPALAPADPVPSCRQELAGEMGTVDQDGTVEAGKGRRNHENEAQNKKAVCGITQETQRLLWSPGPRCLVQCTVTAPVLTTCQAMLGDET